MRVFTGKLVALAVIAAFATPMAQAESKVLNIYNWSDYIAPDTLDVLLTGFCTQARVSPDNIEVEALPDPPGFSRFTDRALAADWVAYHQKHAKLRVVHAFISLSQPHTRGRLPWYSRRY